MDWTNINSNYLDAAAVLNFMRAADDFGGADGRLSSTELSNFMNATIVTWFDNAPLVTPAQIDTEVLGSIAGMPLNNLNLHHFQVCYVLGMYLFMGAGGENRVGNYDYIVGEFNATYGDEDETVYDGDGGDDNEGIEAHMQQWGAEIMAWNEVTDEERAQGRRDQCGVCLETYNVNAPYWITLCREGHRFCANCISRWCGPGRGCPTCRSPFVEDPCRRAGAMVELQNGEGARAGGRRRRRRIRRRNRKGSKSKKSRKSRKSKKSKKSKKSRKTRKLK